MKNIGSEIGLSFSKNFLKNVNDSRTNGRKMKNSKEEGNFYP
jgi:hypothetical protein